MTTIDTILSVLLYFFFGWTAGVLIVSLINDIIKFVEDNRTTYIIDNNEHTWTCDKCGYTASAYELSGADFDRCKCCGRKIHYMRIIGNAEERARVDTNR